MTHLYIQGETPNSWMPAQDWQLDFIDGAQVAPSRINHRGYRYRTFPMGYFHHNSQDYNTLSSIGVLYNATTFMFRMYIRTSQPLDFVESVHTHTGARKMNASFFEKQLLKYHLPFYTEFEGSPNREQQILDYANRVVSDLPSF